MSSAYLVNLPLREQHENQPCLPWISHVISIDNLSECMAIILSYELFHAPDPRVMHVCLHVCYGNHLLMSETIG